MRPVVDHSHPTLSNFVAWQRVRDAIDDFDYKCRAMRRST